MRDDAPSTLRRLLALRQFSALAGVELAELAIVAENAVERTFASGQLVSDATAVRALQLVLEGRIESREQTWGPRDVFGLLEVLAGRTTDAPAIAAEETRTLELAASDTIEVLEDNFGVLHAMLKSLAGQLALLPDDRSPVVPRAKLLPDTGERLTLVERLIVLRQHVPFARGRLQALAAVAHAADEVRWPAGAIVTRTGELADAMLVILEGELAATGRTRRTVRAGEQVGALQTFAGLRHDATLEATTPVRALVCSGRTMLDVLEDHTELGLTMIATFAGALLDAGQIRTN